MAHRTMAKSRRYLGSMLKSTDHHNGGSGVSGHKRTIIHISALVGLQLLAVWHTELLLRKIGQASPKLTQMRSGSFGLKG